MTGAATITTKLADAFYTEAMLLADETRSYLDVRGQAERADLPPQGRVLFACESLNATTRLMQVIAWLLPRRGNVVPIGGRPTDTALPPRPVAAADDLAALPPDFRRLIDAGTDLYDRVRRLDGSRVDAFAGASPALALLRRIERSL